MLRSTVTLLQRCLHGVYVFFIYSSSMPAKSSSIKDIMSDLFSSGGVGTRT